MRIPYLSSMQVFVRRMLIFIALAGLAFFFLTTTSMFQNQLQTRILVVLEEATGARIAVQSFHANIWTRQLVMRGVVARSQRPADKPFFVADSVLVQLRFSTLFITDRELRLLRVERPRIEVTFDKQGITNLPSPGRAKLDPRQSPLDPLFQLAIRRFEVVDGVVIWDDQAHHVDFDLERVAASLNYDPARDRYNGAIATHASEKPANLKKGSLAKSLSWNSQAHFVLERRVLTVTDFSFELGRSTLKGQLTLRDFRAPAIVAAYQTSIDVAEAGSVFKVAALRTGILTAKGNAKYDAKSGFHANGDAHLERATLLAFRDITGDAKFEATPENVRFEPLRASVLGGTAEGRLRIEHIDRDPRFFIETRVAGVSFSKLAATLEEMYPTLPLDRAPLVTNANGDADVSFGGAEEVLVAFRGSLSDPVVVPPGYVAVHGHTDLKLFTANERLVLHDTVLDTASSHVTAEGDARFHITVASTNQKEFEWLGKLPLTMKSTQLDGTLSGPLRSLQYDGRANVDGLVVPVKGRDFPFDHFHGNVMVSSARIDIRDGDLERGPASILFNASAPLVGGQLSDDAPLTASAELRQWDATELLSWLKLDYPVTGAVRGALTSAGTMKSPSVRGSLEVTNGKAWSERFDSAAANITYTAHRLEASNVRLVRGRGRVTGMVQFQDDTNAYKFQATATGIALEDFPQIQLDKFKLAGTADVQANGSGVWDASRIAPTGHSTLTLHNARLNGEAFNDVTITADADGEKATWQLASGRAPAHFGASGDIVLREPYVFHAKIDSSAMDLDPLLQPYLGDEITAHSHFEAEGSLAGELRHFGELGGSMEIRKFDLGLHGIALRNDGVWRASYKNHTVTLQPIKVMGPGTSLVVQGTIDMPPVPSASRAINLRMDGDLNAQLIETMQPGVTSTGLGRVKVSVDGTWDNPQVNGRADIEEMQIGSESFPTSLNHLNGSLLFNRTGMRIERLSGESGGGRINLTGVVDYTRSPRTFQIRAQASGVRMRYPPGVSTVLDADLNLIGNPERSQLSGDIIVQRAGVNATFDLAEALAQVKQASAAPSELSWARTLQLYVRVASSNDIRFESGSRASLDAQFDLRVRGTLADPALLGKMTILDGKISFLKTDYTINRGEIQFINPFRIDPVINMDVSTRKQQYDISLDFSGPLDKLRVNYRSDPPLPVPDIQLLLVLGRAPTGSSSAAYNPALASVGSNTILSDPTSAAVSGRLGRLFGASPLRIDPQSSSVEANPAARVSLVQEVAHDVIITSSTSLSSAQQVIIQVEWNVNRRFSVLATRDQNGLFGIDLKWRKQIR